jgi:hypothetical protein
VRTGRVRFVWPESEHAGIRGMGRGLVAGDEVFWPTRNVIYALHVVTGTRTRRPIDLSVVGGAGANLAAAHGRILAAGPDRLMAFGPTALPPRPADPERREPIAQYPLTSDL